MRAMHIAGLLFLALVAVFTTACRSGSHPGGVVADSAGVRIIEVSWDDAPLLQIDPDPDLVIGEPGGIVDLDLYQIGGVAVPRPGIVLISETSSQQVIRVDLGSGNVSRFGRSGDGPLEFRALSRPLPNTDGHLFLFDNMRRRLLEVTEHGELLQEIDTPDVGRPGQSLLLIPGGPVQLETLYLALLPGFSPNPSGRPYRGEGAVIRLLDPADTLAVFRGTALFTSSTSTGGVMFGATTLVAGSDAGVWLGDTSGESVALWTPGRGLTRIIRWTTRSPRELTEGRVAEFWSRLESSMPPEQRAAIEDMKRALPFADTVPAFGSLVAGVGAIWIGSYQSPEAQLTGERPAATTWLAVDHNGVAASRVVTPAGFTLHVVADDHILGIYRDSLGVESIRRYRLSLSR